MRGSWGLVDDSLVTRKTGLFLVRFFLQWTGHHCRNLELYAVFKNLFQGPIVDFQTDLLIIKVEGFSHGLEMSSIAVL